MSQTSDSTMAYKLEEQDQMNNMTLQGHNSNQGNVTNNRRNSYEFGWGPCPGHAETHQRSRTNKNEHRARTSQELYERACEWMEFSGWCTRGEGKKTHAEAGDRAAPRSAAANHQQCGHHCRATHDQREERRRGAQGHKTRKRGTMQEKGTKEAGRTASFQEKTTTTSLQEVGTVPRPTNHSSGAMLSKKSQHLRLSHQCPQRSRQGWDARCRAPQQARHRRRW